MCAAPNLGRAVQRTVCRPLGGPVGVFTASADRLPLPSKSIRIVVDRATLKQKLLEAKAHGALMIEHIDRQRELVEMLRKRRLGARLRSGRRNPSPR